MERKAEFLRKYFHNILIISKSQTQKTKWLEPLQRTKDYKNLIHISIQERRTKIVSINKERIPSRKSLKKPRPPTLRTAFFQTITQRVAAVPYRRFGKNLSVPFSRVKNTLMMEPINYPETSVRNYLYSLHNSPQKCSSHLFLSGSLI